MLSNGLFWSLFQVKLQEWIILRLGILTAVCFHKGTMEGYSLSRGEIAVDIRLNVN